METNNSQKHMDRKRWREHCYAAYVWLTLDEYVFICVRMYEWEKERDSGMRKWKHERQQKTQIFNY